MEAWKTPIYVSLPVRFFVKDAGFVPFRRGIIEHVRYGRMELDEFAAYTMLLLLADHHNGHWNGCGGSLAAVLGVCQRKGRYLLSSLSRKGYIRLPDKIPARGLYPIQICKYFARRHGRAVIPIEAAQGCRLRRHGRAALQEVKKEQEEKPQEAMPDKHSERLFERFWLAYPEHRRGDPRFLEIEWERMPRMEMDIDVILAGLEIWKKSEQWNEASGRYVPKAVNFLKELMWKHPPREKQKGEDSVERQKRLGYR